MVRFLSIKEILRRHAIAELSPSPDTRCDSNYLLDRTRQHKSSRYNMASYQDFLRSRYSAYKCLSAVRLTKYV